MSQETSAHSKFGLPWNFCRQFFDWSIFSKYGFRLAHSKYRNAAVFFVKLVKAKGGVRLKDFDWYWYATWVMWLLVGEKSRMTSLVAAEQSQNVCLKLVWVIPNEQEVHRTYARHQNGQLWLLCSDDRGAKVMVLLGYILLTTKQVHWLEFVTMSTVKLQSLFVSHVKGWS